MKKNFFVAILLLVVGVALVLVTGTLLFYSNTDVKNKLSRILGNTPANIFFEFKSFGDLNDKTPIKTANYNSDEIERMKINVGACNVRVETSKENLFLVTVYRIKDTSNEPEITLTDKTLTIIADTKNKRLFGFSFNKQKPEYAILINVPENKTLDEFYLKSEVGLSELMQLRVKSFYAQCGVGSVQLKDLQAENFELIGGVGEINFEKLKTNKTKITAGTGKIISRSCAFNDLSYEGGIGEFMFEGAITGKSTVHIGIGKTSINLAGKKSDYNIFVEKGIGHVLIDGKNAGLFDNTHSAENIISVNVGIGNLDIRFTE